MVVKVFFLLLVVAATVSVDLGRYRNDECLDLCNGNCKDICTDLCKLGLNFYRSDSCIDRCNERCHHNCDIVCDVYPVDQPPIYQGLPFIHVPSDRHSGVIALKKYKSDIDSCLKRCNYNCDESCSALCHSIAFGQNYYCSWSLGWCTLKKNNQCIAECHEKCSEACNNDCIV